MRSPNTSHIGRSDQRGFAVVTSLLIVVVIGVFIIGSLTTSQIGAFITRNDVQATQAQYVAVAGMQHYRTAMFQNYRWRVAEAAVDEGAVGSCGLNFGMTVELDLDRTGATSTTLWNVGETITLATDVPVLDAEGNNIGTYDITITKDDETRYVIESLAVSGNARASARAAITIGDSGVLEQAIFAGAGSNAKSINGNIAVHGGVYIEGVVSDPKTIVFDAGGTFQQSNNYDVSSDGAASYLDDHARTATDLCATLRVKDGQINLTSKSVGLGASQPEFTGAKPRLQGVFVDSGTSDILGQLQPDGSTGEYRCNNAGGICADQVGAFDLDRATAPRFPHLDDVPQYPDTCTDTWRTCLENEASDKGLVINALTLSTLPASCSAALDQSGNLELGAADIDCTSGGYGFRYSGSSGRIEVFGTVQIEGFNLVANRDLSYKAVSEDDPFPDAKNATLFFSEDAAGNGGSVIIDGSLQPDASLGAGWSFPSQVLGLIAENTVEFKKRTDVYAPIYAGEEFRITQQSRVFGSVIADTFCTTGAGANAGKCNAGQSIEIFHVSTRANRPPTFRFIQPGTPRATFFSLGVEVN